MNIIPLDQQPDRCPACGSVRRNERACSSACVRISASQFRDATTHDDERPIPVHVHVACAECGFAYLLAVAHLDDVGRVW